MSANRAPAAMNAIAAINSLENDALERAAIVAERQAAAERNAGNSSGAVIASSIANAIRCQKTV